MYYLRPIFFFVRMILCAYDFCVYDLSGHMIFSERMICVRMIFQCVGFLCVSQILSWPICFHMTNPLLVIPC